MLDDRPDRVVERGRRLDGGHRDTRDHDLVDAPRAKLDDRVDHLLLFRLEDALLSAPLDEQLELFGTDRKHTSELQSLMRISYAVFCLKKKKTQNDNEND